MVLKNDWFRARVSLSRCISCITKCVGQHFGAFILIYSIWCLVSQSLPWDGLKWRVFCNMLRGFATCCAGLQGVFKCRPCELQTKKIMTSFPRRIVWTESNAFQRRFVFCNHKLPWNLSLHFLSSLGVIFVFFSLFENSWSTVSVREFLN